MTIRPRRSRRSFVLLTVLVITGSALLLATGALYMMQADSAAGVGMRRAAQTRALGWSGLQAVMLRLHEQRPSLLMGQEPELESQYELYEDGTRLGIVRIVPISGEGLLTAEAGKLDLNHVDARTLAATGLVEEELAGAIIAHRDRSPGRTFQSVAQLLDVPGVTPTMLYGPLDELNLQGRVSGTDVGITERVADRLDDQPVKGLADIVTVYGFEPVLQSDGMLRIRLDLKWDEELARRCEERFGDLVGDVEALVQARGMESDADIVRELRRRNVPVERWPELLDAFTTEPGTYQFGRLDLNTAPYEALVGLPSLEAGQAEQIIRTRDRLAEEERATVTWPVSEKIVDEDAFAQLADRVTTRCFTWRVRLAAGEVLAEDPDGPLMNPVLYEAVVDLSGPTPRLAYLRDITLLETAALLAAYETTEEDESDEMPDEAEFADSVPSSDGLEGDGLVDDDQDLDAPDPMPEPDSQSGALSGASSAGPIPAPINPTGPTNPAADPGRRIGRSRSSSS